jgi:5-methylcytosine-specific restriction endonuclease McrA
MQFTTTEEHVQLVERAKALLARPQPGVTLAELHTEAMKLLVASLEKRKFAVTDRPLKQAAAQGSEPLLDASGNEDGNGGDAKAAESGLPAVEPRAPTRPADEPRMTPRQRGRYVPAAERREVFTRDEGRCTFTDAHGQRCRETRHLELHHLKPFARAGENVASNLTLRCSAHNALAAEQDFGRELIASQRDSTRHESRAAQERARLAET